MGPYGSEDRCLMVKETDMYDDKICYYTQLAWESSSRPLGAKREEILDERNVDPWQIAKYIEEGLKRDGKWKPEPIEGPLVCSRTSIIQEPKPETGVEKEPVVMERIFDFTPRGYNLDQLLSNIPVSFVMKFALYIGSLNPHCKKNQSKLPDNWPVGQEEPSRTEQSLYALQTGWESLHNGVAIHKDWKGLFFRTLEDATHAGFNMTSDGEITYTPRTLAPF